MIQFNRLRINGFKSFVDRTELEIAPGLNGIVGPNGCGKSNLVEALRWVMGESSAKRMRGDGMEDVIFNGTAKRSPRNIAEVSILLDNTARTAPAAYNGSDEIEVIRRIERDHGSNYKINGKNARARDVQMLFADTVTGANSPAMVSQGRITQIINAKPLERRIILEESAGISGLYARRHEAELRLRAADQNLVRLNDILGGMEGRLNGLKRQARQAGRYRNLSTQIRQMEIMIAWLEWQALEERAKHIREQFGAAESIVAEKMITVTQLTKTQTTQAEELPALRKREAELAAALQTKRLNLQRLEDEQARLKQDLEEAQAQLTQTVTDIEHESTSMSESTGLLARLEEEQKRILGEQEREDGQLAEKTSIKEELEARVLALEEQYTILMKTTAEANAQKQSLEQRIARNKEHLETLAARRDKAQAEEKDLAAADTTAAERAQLDRDIAALEKSVEKTTGAIEKARKDITSREQELESARETVKKSQAENTEYQSEIKALESILESDSQHEYPPVIDQIKPQAGFETALSRALGDALLASLEESAPSYWTSSSRDPSSLPPLPGTAESLLPYVEAPKVMALALSQIGVVDTKNDGEKLLADLLPGQSLVSKDGWYWRWDGLTCKPDAADQHAQNMERKNRLEVLKKERGKIEKLVEKAQQTQQAAQEKLDTAKQALQDLQDSQNAYGRELNEKRSALASLREQLARQDSERKRIADTLSTLADDIAQAQKALAEDQTQYEIYTQDSEKDKSEQIEALRQSLNETRESHSESVRAFDILVQKQKTREARLRAIADERVNSQNRSIRAKARLQELEERKALLAKRTQELKATPSNFKAESEKLLEEVTQLENARNEAAEGLAKVEHDVSETGRALKEAENILGEAREKRAHAQATLSGIDEQRATLEEQIAEQFDLKPQELPEHAAIDMDKNLDELPVLKQRKEKLTRERDNIGPVNLRAEDEATELEKEVGGILHERNDLQQAIDELRAGIETINKEARERLLAAFEHVNAHFQRLFVTLFTGGQAHLALVDSDDPLGAGLEIYAQPPGKALQSLSLLSGGEQTLASIALIFGMFLTNPSPICVLDEIDAPLDDANVDRVCDLLEEIAERGETRFLIITHHRLTMARMDRLYGVTMAEKGVSQLVSVDLQQSFSFLEEAA